eukprot:gene12404-15595_t
MEKKMREEKVAARAAVERRALVQKDEMIRDRMAAQQYADVREQHARSRGLHRPAWAEPLEDGYLQAGDRSSSGPDHSARLALQQGATPNVRSGLRPASAAPTPSVKALSTRGSLRNIRKSLSRPDVDAVSLRPVPNSTNSAIMREASIVGQQVQVTFSEYDNDTRSQASFPASERWGGTQASYMAAAYDDATVIRVRDPHVSPSWAKPPGRGPPSVLGSQEGPGPPQPSQYARDCRKQPKSSSQPPTALLSTSDPPSDAAPARRRVRRVRPQSASSHREAGRYLSGGSVLASPAPKKAATSLGTASQAAAPRPLSAAPSPSRLRPASKKRKPHPVAGASIPLGGALLRAQGHQEVQPGMGATTSLGVASQPPHPPSKVSSEVSALREIALALQKRLESMQVAKASPPSSEAQVEAGGAAGVREQAAEEETSEDEEDEDEDEDQTEDEEEEEDGDDVVAVSLVGQSSVRGGGGGGVSWRLNLEEVVGGGEGESSVHYPGHTVPSLSAGQQGMGITFSAGIGSLPPGPAHLGAAPAPPADVGPPGQQAAADATASMPPQQGNVNLQPYPSGRATVPVSTSGSQPQQRSLSGRAAVSASAAGSQAPPQQSSQQSWAVSDRTSNQGMSASSPTHALAPALAPAPPALHQKLPEGTAHPGFVDAYNAAVAAMAATSSISQWEGRRPHTAAEGLSGLMLTKKPRVSLDEIDVDHLPMPTRYGAFSTESFHQLPMPTQPGDFSNGPRPTAHTAMHWARAPGRSSPPPLSAPGPPWPVAVAWPGVGTTTAAPAHWVSGVPFPTGSASLPGSTSAVLSSLQQARRKVAIHLPGPSASQQRAAGHTAAVGDMGGAAGHVVGLESDGDEAGVSSQSRLSDDGSEDELRFDAEARRQQHHINELYSNDGADHDLIPSSLQLAANAPDPSDTIPADPLNVANIVLQQLTHQAARANISPGSAAQPSEGPCPAGRPADSQGQYFHSPMQAERQRQQRSGLGLVAVAPAGSGYSALELLVRDSRGRGQEEERYHSRPSELDRQSQASLHRYKHSVGREGVSLSVQRARAVAAMQKDLQLADNDHLNSPPVQYKHGAGREGENLSVQRAQAVAAMQKELQLAANAHLLLGVASLSQPVVSEKHKDVAFLFAEQLGKNRVADAVDNAVFASGSGSAYAVVASYPPPPVQAYTLGLGSSPPGASLAAQVQAYTLGFGSSPTGASLAAQGTVVVPKFKILRVKVGLGLPMCLGLHADDASYPPPPVQAYTLGLGSSLPGASLAAQGYTVGLDTTPTRVVESSTQTLAKLSAELDADPLGWKGGTAGLVLGVGLPSLQSLQPRLQMTEYDREEEEEREREEQRGQGDQRRQIASPLEAPPTKAFTPASGKVDWADAFNTNADSAHMSDTMLDELSASMAQHMKAELARLSDALDKLGDRSQQQLEGVAHEMDAAEDAGDAQRHHALMRTERVIQMEYDAECKEVHRQMATVRSTHSRQQLQLHQLANLARIQSKNADLPSNLPFKQRPHQQDQPAQIPGYGISPTRSTAMVGGPSAEPSASFSQSAMGGLPLVKPSASYSQSAMGGGPMAKPSASFSQSTAYSTPSLGDAGSSSKPTARQSQQKQSPPQFQQQQQSAPPQHQQQKPSFTPHQQQQQQSFLPQQWHEQQRVLPQQQQPGVPPQQQQPGVPPQQQQPSVTPQQQQPSVPPQQQQQQQQPSLSSQQQQPHLSPKQQQKLSSPHTQQQQEPPRAEQGQQRLQPQQSSTKTQSPSPPSQQPRPSQQSQQQSQPSRPSQQHTVPMGQAGVASPSPVVGPSGSSGAYSDDDHGVEFGTMQMARMPIDEAMLGREGDEQEWSADEDVKGEGERHYSEGAADEGREGERYDSEEEYDRQLQGQGGAADKDRGGERYSDEEYSDREAELRKEEADLTRELQDLNVAISAGGDAAEPASHLPPDPHVLGGSQLEEGEQGMQGSGWSGDSHDDRSVQEVQRFGWSGESQEQDGGKPEVQDSGYGEVRRLDRPDPREGNDLGSYSISHSASCSEGAAQQSSVGSRQEGGEAGGQVGVSGESLGLRYSETRGNAQGDSGSSRWEGGEAGEQLSESEDLHELASEGYSGADVDFSEDGIEGAGGGYSDDGGLGGGVEYSEDEGGAEVAYSGDEGSAEVAYSEDEGGAEVDYTLASELASKDEDEVEGSIEYSAGSQAEGGVEPEVEFSSNSSQAEAGGHEVDLNDHNQHENQSVEGGNEVHDALEFSVGSQLAGLSGVELQYTHGSEDGSEMSDNMHGGSPPPGGVGADHRGFGASEEAAQKRPLGIQEHKDEQLVQGKAGVQPHEEAVQQPATLVTVVGSQEELLLDASDVLAQMADELAERVEPAEAASPDSPAGGGSIGQLVSDSDSSHEILMDASDLVSEVPEPSEPSDANLYDVRIGSITDAYGRPTIAFSEASSPACSAREGSGSGTRADSNPGSATNAPKDDGENSYSSDPSFSAEDTEIEEDEIGDEIGNDELDIGGSGDLDSPWGSHLTRSGSATRHSRAAFSNKQAHSLSFASSIDEADSVVAGISDVGEITDLLEISGLIEVYDIPDDGYSPFARSPLSSMSLELPGDKGLTLQLPDGNSDEGLPATPMLRASLVSVISEGMEEGGAEEGALAYAASVGASEASFQAGLDSTGTSPAPSARTSSTGGVAQTKAASEPEKTALSASASVMAPAVQASAATSLTGRALIDALARRAASSSDSNDAMLMDASDLLAMVDSDPNDELETGAPNVTKDSEPRQLESASGSSDEILLEASELLAAADDVPEPSFVTAATTERAHQVSSPVPDALVASEPNRKSISETTETSQQVSAPLLEASVTSDPTLVSALEASYDDFNVEARVVKQPNVDELAYGGSSSSDREDSDLLEAPSIAGGDGELETGGVELDAPSEGYSDLDVGSDDLMAMQTAFDDNELVEQDELAQFQVDMGDSQEEEAEEQAHSDKEKPPVETPFVPPMVAAPDEEEAEEVDDEDELLGSGEMEKPTLRAAEVVSKTAVVQLSPPQAAAAVSPVSLPGPSKAAGELSDDDMGQLLSSVPSQRTAVEKPSELAEGGASPKSSDQEACSPTPSSAPSSDAMESDGIVSEYSMSFDGDDVASPTAAPEPEPGSSKPVSKLASLLAANPPSRSSIDDGFGDDNDSPGNDFDEEDLGWGEDDLSLDTAQIDYSSLMVPEAWDWLLGMVLGEIDLDLDTDQIDYRSLMVPEAWDWLLGMVLGEDDLDLDTDQIYYGSLLVPERDQEEIRKAAAPNVNLKSDDIEAYVLKVAQRMSLGPYHLIQSAIVDSILLPTVLHLGEEPLSLDGFLTLERSLLDVTDEQHIFNKLLYDCANETLLDIYRSCNRLEAPSWIRPPTNHVVKPLPSSAELAAEVSKRVVEWSAAKVKGLPDLDKILGLAAAEDERTWFRLEEQEAEVKMEIAEMVWDDLMLDTADALQWINERSIARG